MFVATVSLKLNAAQQIVGRERGQRACHRQLVRNTVVSRRVNSDVRRLREMSAAAGLTNAIFLALDPT
jgi:hypothetical protein